MALYELYGIASCTTVRKARQWLDARGIAYQFHDFKTKGAPEFLSQWCDQLGWQVICNKASLTWRNLPEETRASIQDQASAITLMQERPNLIKRPVLVQAERVLLLGFKETEWQATVL
jgi:arsenate reductase